MKRYIMRRLRGGNGWLKIRIQGSQRAMLNFSACPV